MAGPAARALSEALPEKAAAAVCDFINGALLDDPHRMGEPLDPPQATAIQHRADAGRTRPGAPVVLMTVKSRLTLGASVPAG